jgi:hypothetical protein
VAVAALANAGRKLSTAASFYEKAGGYNASQSKWFSAVVAIPAAGTLSDLATIGNTLGVFGTKDQKSRSLTF